MTENEALRYMVSYKMGRGCKPQYPDAVLDEAFSTTITALKEIQQYREIGTIEEIRKMINQGINNCYMSHKYEHPGYEEGMCAGLRTMNGDGEPVYKCKLCRLNYLFERSEGE